MTKNIQIVPDAGVPEGGHAIIRLDGVWLLPEPATFRIEPLDERNSAVNPKGWPTGECKPRNIRTTARGIELLIGPEIVDAPDLLPGTPISISVPAADVQANVRWPELPTSRPSNPDQAILQQTKSSVVAKVRRAGMNGTTVTAANSNTATRPEDIASEARPAEKASKAEPSKERGLSELSKPTKDAAKIAILENLPTSPSRRESLNKGSPAPVVSGNRRTSALSALWPLVVGLLVTGGLMAVLSPGLQKDIAVLQEARNAGATNAAQAVDIAAIFEVEEASPRGAISSDVDGREALRLANQFLHGADGPADKAEGAFWLRKAISQQLSDQKLTWALTQLGSIYAAPASGSPDYQSAKLLWELAAANGDPVAACFVGQLHEHGLGVVADADSAKTSYERAKRLGGCPGLETALARVAGKN